VFAKKTQYERIPAEWTKFEFDMTGEDLSKLRAGFIWVVNRDENPGAEQVELYVDDITFIKLAPPAR